MQLNMNSEIFTSSESLPYILTLLRCVQDGKHVWVADENEATAAKAYGCGSSEVMQRESF